jgi:hypothetical protein
MTSVCGHVMNLDFIGKYNNWDRVDPVSCFCVTELYQLLKCFNIKLCMQDEWFQKLVVGEHPLLG